MMRIITGLYNRFRFLGSEFVTQPIVKQTNARRNLLLIEDFVNECQKYHCDTIPMYRNQSGFVFNKRAQQILNGNYNH